MATKLLPKPPSPARAHTIAHLLLTVAMLAGCGVSGTILARSPSEQVPDAGHLVILRVSQVPGAAVTVPVAIDGSQVAELGTGEYLDFAVEPGPHLVAVGFLGREITERVDVSAGERHYYRFSFKMFSPSALDHLEKLSTSEGAREVSDGGYDELSAARAPDRRLALEASQR